MTGAIGWRCEYTYTGYVSRTFWRMYTGSCPNQIEIE